MGLAHGGRGPVATKDLIIHTYTYMNIIYVYIQVYMKLVQGEIRFIPFTMMIILVLHVTLGSCGGPGGAGAGWAAGVSAGLSRAC